MTSFTLMLIGQKKHTGKRCGTTSERGAAVQSSPTKKGKGHVNDYILPIFFVQLMILRRTWAYDLRFPLAISHLTTALVSELLFSLFFEPRTTVMMSREVAGSRYWVARQNLAILRGFTV